MRRIAVVGAGIAGLLTAHGLRRAGHEVTLFSDRTAEQWLHARPTGTAARFEPALAYERELGLDHWHAAAPPIGGTHTVFCPRPGNILATGIGRLPRPGAAIDVRLQSHRWMHDLTDRGGRVVIEAVSLARLDEIAGQHDLTVVAAGRGELAALFERDPDRSGHSEPARNVAMVLVHGPTLERAGVPFLAIKNIGFEGIGEALWVPYFHRDIGPCWNLLFEAVPGGPMDVFLQARSGAEVLALARRIIDTLIPWESEWSRDIRLADDMGWLVGSITPTVRRPVGRLPSGRIVTCVGDTAIHFDPLAAQGANNGTKMARHLVEAVNARGDAAFDGEWMTATFERFWHDHGRPAYALTDLFLEPMIAAGIQLSIATYGSDGVRQDGRQALADAFAGALADPRPILAAVADGATARRFITATTGKSWLRLIVTGFLRIARAQLRQKFGLPPNHPVAP